MAPEPAAVVPDQSFGCPCCDSKLSVKAGTLTVVEDSGLRKKHEERGEELAKAYELAQGHETALTACNARIRVLEDAARAPQPQGDGDPGESKFVL
jgi:hypothetical protein